MIINYLNSIKEIVEEAAEINYSAITRLNMFVPEDLPAACVQVNEESDEGDLLNQALKDDVFNMVIGYFEKAGVNRDQTEFLTNVHGIKKALRKSGDLNCRAMDFAISIEYQDRQADDNLEFIALISIAAKIANSY